MTENYLDIIENVIEFNEEDCSEDSESIIILDDEMDKYGSLHENSIDWQRAEETALYILKERCKNLRVLAHLMVCLQHSRDAERFVLSIQLLCKFLEKFWESAKPEMQSENRSITVKRKILKQILLRTEQAAERLDLTEGDRALTQSLTDHMSKLKAEVEKTSLDYEGYWKVTNAFKKALPAEVVTLKNTGSAVQVKNGGQTQQPGTAQEKNTALESDTKISLPQIKLHGSNERETKQTLFKVATLLNSAMPHESLGFRMRRFALWFNITSMPALRKDGTTEMMAIPSDRVTDYAEALSKTPNEDLLMKIEHSVSVSPFWINGSYLSSRVADAIEMNEVSDAIREETIRFTKRLPDLLDAKFSDGTDFVDSATRQWLAPGGGSIDQGGSGSEWTEKMQQAVQTAKNGKYKKALSLLEKGSSSAEQPRDKFYWRLATADFMHNTDMNSLANEEYRSLLAHAEELNIHAWEPFLVDGLRQKAGIEQQNESIAEKKK